MVEQGVKLEELCKSHVTPCRREGKWLNTRELMQLAPAQPIDVIKGRGGVRAEAVPPDFRMTTLVRAPM